MEKSTPKDARTRIVTLSFLRRCTFIDIAPAKRRKGNITFRSIKLKSKLTVIEKARSMNEGKKKPRIRINTDKAIAITIKPIVIGSFKNLKFTIEKIDAKISKMVLSSRISNFWFSNNE